MASLIRREFARALTSRLYDRERYQTKGSPGNGRWAEVPWAAVFDTLVTATAQSGIYLVYLVSADKSGAYLSLNQGVTSIREQYGAGAHLALRARGKDLATRLGPLTKGLLVGPIELASPEKDTLGSHYESGAICSVYYRRDDLPSSEVFEADFSRMLSLYSELVARSDLLATRMDIEDDELALSDEDARLLREHKRVERNRGLAKRAKRAHGYKCKACGFDFESVYGAIGRFYIEAHHLVPMSALKGKVVPLSPANDFTVLCANCHRMIHRTDLVGDIEAFKQVYLSGGVE